MDAAKVFATLTANQRALLRELATSGSRYLVVGGYAVRCHGCEREPKDLDVWLDRTPDNARRVADIVIAVSAAQGLSLDPSRDKIVAALVKPEVRLSWGQLTCPGDACYEVELFTSMKGVCLDFEDAVQRAVLVPLEDTEVRVVGLHHLIAMKEASVEDPARPPVAQQVDSRDLAFLRSRLGCS